MKAVAFSWAASSEEKDEDEDEKLKEGRVAGSLPAMVTEG